MFAGQYVVTTTRDRDVIDDLPLVLFAGTSPDASLPGYTRAAQDIVRIQPDELFDPEGHEVFLNYTKPDTRAVVLNMYSRIGPCSPSRMHPYMCEVIGRVSGGELRSYVSRDADTALFPPTLLAVAYPDGSGVTTNVVAAIEDDAREAPAGLRRVGREKFERATGARLDFGRAWTR